MMKSNRGVLRVVAAWAPFMVAMMTGCGGDASAPTDVPSATDASSDSPAASDAPVDPGLAVILRSGCRNCHQSTDAAEGVLSGQTTPRPNTTAYGSNLTPDMTGLAGRSEADIVAAILMGVGANGRTLCPTMPRYRMMSNADATLVAQYLRSLPPVRRMIPMNICAATDGGTTPSADASTDASADR